MKQNQDKLKRYMPVVLTVIVLLTAIASVLVTKRNSTEAAPSQKSSQKETTKQFTFLGAKDWRQGPSNKTSMALFYNPSDCFVSVQYKTGTVNATAELQDWHDGFVELGYPPKTGVTHQITINTTAGAKQLDMHQYIVTGDAKGDNKPYEGNETGFLQLANGYIKAEAYCDSVSNLPAAVPAFKALRFNGLE